MTQARRHLSLPGRPRPRSPLHAGGPWERFAGGGGSQARGSLLLAMLVTMTIGSIVLATASTQWSFIIRREKERELIFRGVQIARAIDEWQGPGKGPPTSLESMTKPPRPVLRKAYADPMTAQYGDDGKLIEGTGEWGLIVPGGPQGGVPGAPSGPTGATAASAPRPPEASGRGGLGARATPQVTPFVGVHTKSEELSISSYLQAPPETPLNEWEFRGLGLNNLGAQQVGGYEIPRPPGFGGLRLPGGPPLQATPPGGAMPGATTPRAGPTGGLPRQPVGR